MTALRLMSYLMLDRAQLPLAAHGIFTGQLFPSVLVALIARVTSMLRGTAHIYEM